MNSRALSVVVNIGGKLLPSLNSAATKVEERFATMGRRMQLRAAEMKATWRSTMASAAPLLGLAAAGGLAMTARDAIGDSAGLAHDIQMLRNAGRTSREVADSMAAANRTIMDVPTSTLRDNLHILSETTLAYGGLSHAMENLSFNAKMGALLKGQLGDEFGGPDTFNKLVRLIELRGGKVDSTTYQRLANSFYRAMTVSGGTVNPDELLGFGQQSLPAMRAYSESYLSTVVPSLIQEFGGERAGTVSSALALQFMGRVPVGGMRLVKLWQKYGLLKPGTGGTGGKGGRAGWNPQDVVGLNLGLSDPLAYFEKIMIPHLKAHGVNLNDPQQVMVVASQLFGRQTGARIASTFLDPKQLARIHADMGLYGKAPGVNQAYLKTLHSDPTFAWTAVTAQMHNLLSVIFGTAKGESPVAMALVHIARGLHSITAAFQRFPKLGQGIGALLIGATGLATLKVLGVGLRFILSPLGLILRIMSPLAQLGPIVLNGLLRLAPLVIEGITAAFALLSNPVGWAIILVGVGAALAYYFRGTLMRIWQGGWRGLVNWVKSIDWRGIGMSIANALTFGLAGKFVSALNNLKATAGAKVGMNSTRGGLAGARAGGGSVGRGLSYLVGERGPEIFTPGASGYVSANRHIAAMSGGPRHYRPGRGGLGPVTIVVNGAQEPHLVAREVRRELHRLANGQAALLSD